MRIQPATMQSRDAPTRSPWYSPMLTVFIQHVEAPPPALHTHTVYSAMTCPHCLWKLYCRLHKPHPSFSFTLSDTETLSLAMFPCIYALLLKTSHTSLKMELWFQLPLKIRTLRALTLMTAILVPQI